MHNAQQVNHRMVNSNLEQPKNNSLAQAVINVPPRGLRAAVPSFT